MRAFIKLTKKQTKEIYDFIDIDRIVSIEDDTLSDRRIVSTVDGHYHYVEESVDYIFNKLLEIEDQRNK